ncbi:MAG: phosphotransferase [Acidobacteria bacterium]|nr:phosphotransferase [Acidobacteriota bacterium]
MELERGEHDRKALDEWLAGAGFEVIARHHLPGDVSPRRYERLTGAGGTTAIAALYPAELCAACRRFARSTEILAGAGVAVPRVLAAECERGWVLLEDLRELTLADLRDHPWSELGTYFETAAAVAARIAALPVDQVRDLNPPLDRDLMLRELAQTRDVFLEPRGLLAGHPGDTDGNPGDSDKPAIHAGPAALGEALELLCIALGAEPPVPCHRDYMSRNLVPQERGGIAVLDHQDLRLGPPAYDLASLLNDTLFPPPLLERRLVDAAFPGAAGRLRYHRAAAQRTLKAVGSYAAFAHRGFPRHLPLIGPTLRRFLRHFGETPEGARLVPGLERAWSGVLGPPD